MDEILNNIQAKKQKMVKLLKNKDNKNSLHKWLTTELAYTSNAIEGNTLTRQETALVIEEKITSGSKPLNDYLEAQNHADAYQFILESAENQLSINENVVLKIHKHILKGVDDMNAGFYRSVKVRISGSQTILPNPLKVPDLMGEFGKWLETTKDEGAIKAIEAHYRLVTIHPFSDGNGRTARLLMNLILLEAGYVPIIIRLRDRKRYLTALENRQTKEKIEPYNKFMLEALNRSMDTVIEMLDVNTPDVSEEKLLTISKFAKLAELPVSTIRYWVEIGKLKPVAKTPSDYMLFSPKQIKDLK